MQLWLLDYLATSLDLSTISGLHIIERDYFLIKDQWKNFDINVSRISPTMSSQQSFYRISYGSSDEMTSVSFFLIFIYQTKKAMITSMSWCASFVWLAFIKLFWDK